MTMLFMAKLMIIMELSRTYNNVVHASLDSPIQHFICWNAGNKGDWRTAKTMQNAKYYALNT